MKNNEKSSKNVGSGIWFEVIWFHRILLRIESQEIGRGKKKTNEMTETRSRKDDWLGGQLRRHKRQPGRPTVEQQVAPSCQAGRQNKNKKSGFRVREKGGRTRCTHSSDRKKKKEKRNTLTIPGDGVKGKKKHGFHGAQLWRWPIRTRFCLRGKPRSFDVGIPYRQLKFFSEQAEKKSQNQILFNNNNNNRACEDQLVSDSEMEWWKMRSKEERKHPQSGHSSCGTETEMEETAKQKTGKPLPSSPKAQLWSLRR